MSRVLALKEKRESIQNCMDILIYATHATMPFKLSELRRDVVESTKAKAYSIIIILMDLGYIEKVTCTTYQATEFAKGLFGVNVTTRDGEGR
ncbi:hypothetical protein [Acinetobacter sp. ESBL14]|uniref:hypothetical protein n=1 Tax=Acinetobacter sp. ESBL14 TaxID=3077329 RepID=UPI002FCA129F